MKSDKNGNVQLGFAWGATPVGLGPPIITKHGQPPQHRPNIKIFHVFNL